MVNHQTKVIQALVSSFTEGGRGVSGTPHPHQPENHSSFMSLKLHHFAVVYGKY